MPKFDISFPVTVSPVDGGGLPWSRTVRVRIEAEDAEKAVAYLGCYLQGRLAVALQEEREVAKNDPRNGLKDFEAMREVLGGLAPKEPLGHGDVVGPLAGAPGPGED